MATKIKPVTEYKVHIYHITIDEYENLRHTLNKEKQLITKIIPVYVANQISNNLIVEVRSITE